MKSKYQGKHYKKKRSIKHSSLYAAFMLSICSALISCVCLASFTFAWFSSKSTTNMNSIDAGVIAVELFKSNDTYEPRIDINEDQLLFDEDDSLSLGSEIVKDIVISNYGTLPAEYGIGLRVTADDVDNPYNNIGKFIDVFITKIDETKIGEEDFEEPGNDDYIYLGDLEYLSNSANSHYEDDEYIYIKGLLENCYADTFATGTDICDYEDYYRLKFKMANEIEDGYESIDLSINIELVSTRYFEQEICTIKALSNNNDFGLVRGGGTYYVNADDTVTLVPLAKPGYKFQKWEDNGSYVAERTVSTSEDQTYRAIFVVEAEYEEHDIDPGEGDF